MRHFRGVSSLNRPSNALREVFAHPLEMTQRLREAERVTYLRAHGKKAAELVVKVYLTKVCF